MRNTTKNTKASTSRYKTGSMPNALPLPGEKNGEGKEKKKGRERDW